MTETDTINRSPNGIRVVLESDPFNPRPALVRKLDYVFFTFREDALIRFSIGPGCDTGSPPSAADKRLDRARVPFIRV